MLLASFLMQAQEPVSIHLTEKDGLPDIEFYDIIEDSRGFVWLAADKGLYRYDGRNYKNYTNKEKITLSVFELQEDNKGRIWCTNITGQFFYVENDELITFVDLGKELNSQLSNFFVTDEYLIVFGFHNMYQVNLKTKEKIILDKGYSHYGKPSLKQNEYIYTTKNTIECRDQDFRPKASILFDFLNIEKNSTTGLRGKPALFFTKNNSFLSCYFNGKNKFYRFDFKTQSIQTIKTPQLLKTNAIVGIFKNHEEIWFQTRSGIHVYEFKRDTFIYKKTFFKGEFITKILVDSNQNYWFITKGNGIFIIPNLYILEHEITPNITRIDKINKDSILYGTGNGDIGIYNFRLEQGSAITINDAVVSALVYNPLKNKATISLESGLSTFNLNNSSVIKLGSLGSVKSFSLVDDNTTLYASYNNAGFLEDQIVGDYPKYLRHKRAYSTYYSKSSKTAFVGYSDQLIAYDSVFKETIILNKEASVFALSITETKNKMIWVSTFKDGVFGIRNNQAVINYTTENGLISNQTGQIKADGNELWIATDKGVQLLDVENGRLKTLTKEEGIPSYQINGIEVLKDRVIFSSNKGVFSIDKAKVFKKIALPKVYFTKVEINKKDTLVLEKYHLPYDQNAIKIGFNANGFKSEKYNKYQYRLLSENTKNEEWEVADALVNAVTYNSLQPGNYTFQLKPFLDKENKASSIKSIAIIIHKPFWEMWWFYVLILMAIGSLFYLYFNSKIKRLKASQKLQLEKEIINKQLVLSQLENLRSQMNPHFIFNALNSIQEYIVLNEKELASTFLIKFSRLMRIYLEHSRQDQVTLDEEIKALKLYLELEKNRFEEALDYVINVEDAISKTQVKIPSLFIQPYVENALKHGLLHKKANRKLLVDYKLDDLEQDLVCTIEDNGIGIPASKEINKNRKFHKSFATQANLKRVELLNANRSKAIEVETIDLNDQSKHTGTRIIITIPLEVGINDNRSII